MDILKKFWPASFNLGSVKNLVITVIVYVVVGYVIGFVLGLVGGLLSEIPLVGLLLSAIGTIVSLYCTAGAVFCFLSYFKVFK